MLSYAFTYMDHTRFWFTMSYVLKFAISFVRINIFNHVDCMYDYVCWRIIEHVTHNEHYACRPSGFFSCWRLLFMYTMFIQMLIIKTNISIMSSCLRLLRLIHTNDIMVLTTNRQPELSALTQITTPLPSHQNLNFKSAIPPCMRHYLRRKKISDSAVAPLNRQYSQ